MKKLPMLCPYCDKLVKKDARLLDVYEDHVLCDDCMVIWTKNGKNVQEIRGKEAPCP